MNYRRCNLLLFCNPITHPKTWGPGVIVQAVLAMSLPAQIAVQQQQASAGVPQGKWTSDKVTHLIGLSEVKPKLQGTLRLSPANLRFATRTGETTIERARVLSLSIGEERTERGGKMGKIARSAIPFGGGSALAAMTGTRVDLLTIEFRDLHNAYHGAVFMLPKDEAVRVQEQLSLAPPEPLTVPPPPPCHAEAVRPSTIRVARIASRGEELPSEYKVLLYEHLVRRLHDQPGLHSIYRDGDTSDAAGCPELTLTLTVHAFTKGNAVLRASTGPLGMFLGTTQLKFEMELRDYTGKVLLDKELKASQRGDNESLEIADDIAKSVSKKLKKATTQKPT